MTTPPPTRHPGSHAPRPRLAALLVIMFTALTAPADEEADRLRLAVDALTRMENTDLESRPEFKARVLRILAKTRGTPDFVALVRHFQLRDQEAGLLEFAQAQPASEAGVEAARSLLGDAGAPWLRRALTSTNHDLARRTAEVLGQTADRRSVPFLAPLPTNLTVAAEVRKEAVRGLARTPEGASNMLAVAAAGRLPDDLRFTAATVLAGVRWPALKAEAARVFPPLAGQGAPLPPLSELLKLRGNPAAGARVFTRDNVGCNKCHVVNGQGTELGPNLSAIGSKLTREALFEAILEPSAGISMGFEAWNVELKSGDEIYGLLVTDTPDELAIRNTAGLTTRHARRDVVRAEKSRVSIMPAGLQQAMTAQELADLIDYLGSLRTAQGTPATKP